VLFELVNYPQRTMYLDPHALCDPPQRPVPRQEDTMLCLFGQRQGETTMDCEGASVSRKMCQPPLGP
jgi:hypothetical protein